MIIKFKNGLSGAQVDWSEHYVTHGAISKKVESENPGEAGLITYDSCNLTLKYETGSAVYNAFSGDLTSAQRYIFELIETKEDQTEVQIFEGIADFSSIENEDEENVISFDVVDKLSAMNIISGNTLQRGAIINAGPRINTVDYMYDIIKRIVPGSGVWLEIQTYILVNNNGTLERGSGIAHTQVILQIGETFQHPDEAVGLCLVTDSKLAESMGGWQTTFVKIQPLKSCDLALPLSDTDELICVTGNIFQAEDVIYLERNNQIEFIRILNAGFGSSVSWIYEVERNYIGDTSYSWNAGETVVFSDTKLTHIMNLSSPPESTYLWYYSNSYYGLQNINILGADSYGRTVLKSFDAINMIKAIVGQAWSSLTYINRTGADTFPISLDYYRQLVDYEPFGQHPFDALKMLANSLCCYVFFSRLGELILQKKSLLDGNTSRTFEGKYRKGGRKKKVWDKIVDAVEVTVKTGRVINDTLLEGFNSSTIYSDNKIKPRNKISVSIFAPDTAKITLFDLDAVAETTAEEYINFYGKRHSYYPLSLVLTDDMLEWEIIDNITINSVLYFIAGMALDTVACSLDIELVEIAGHDYNPGTILFPLAEETSSSSFASSSSSSGTTSFGGSAYTAKAPLKIATSEIQLEYEDNLKLSEANKLDTIQNIKTTGTPQFAKLGIGMAIDATHLFRVNGASRVESIGIGGDVESAFKAKIYGDTKITGSLTVDGDIYIGGSINQVNVTDLNISDHSIRLNKGGDNSTAIGGGIELLGTSDAILASIIYDANGNWSLNKHLNISSGNDFKVNNVSVLNATTLGSAVVNSSLTKVGTLTTGVWNATAINAGFINYNTTHFQNTTNQLTAKNITAGSNNGMSVTTPFTLGSAIVIDTPQDIRVSAAPTFAGLLLTGTATTRALAPSAVYAYDIGSLVNKYRSLYAAELWVETLVAQSTQATIGGRIVVGPTTILIADLASGASTVDVKYSLGNASTNNIICKFEANGIYEFVKLTSAATAIAGGYRYSITKGISGGYNGWSAGDAMVSTGAIGGGFIDMYSINSMRTGVTQIGPAIVGNVRNSLTYNDWSEHWAIGNLNGLYGFTTDKYGVGLGKYSNSSSFMTYEPTNGIRMINKDASGTETVVIKLAQDGSYSKISGYYLDATNIWYGNVTKNTAGNIVIGDNLSGLTNVYNNGLLIGYSSTGSNPIIRMAANSGASAIQMYNDGTYPYFGVLRSSVWNIRIGSLYAFDNLLATTLFGIALVDTNGNYVFRSGSDNVHKIAGFNFNTTQIYGVQNSKYTGMQLPAEAATKCFHAGADDATGNNARFYVQADGKIVSKDASGNTLFDSENSYLDSKNLGRVFYSDNTKQTTTSTSYTVIKRGSLFLLENETAVQAIFRAWLSGTTTADGNIKLVLYPVYDSPSQNSEIENYGSAITSNEGTFGNGYTSCFNPNNTFITLLNGTKRLLKYVKIGDKVVSYNEDKRIFESSAVGAIRKGRTRKIYGITKPNDRRETFVTGEHPFFTTKGWMKLKDITTEKVLTAHKVFLPIVKKEYPCDMEVWTLTMHSGNKNFIANDYVVHNKGTEKPYLIFGVCKITTGLTANKLYKWELMAKTANASYAANVDNICITTGRHIFTQTDSTKLLEYIP